MTHLEVTTPMQGYGDLDVLKELPVQRFLVTSGFRRLQESKISRRRIRFKRTAKAAKLDLPAGSQIEPASVAYAFR